MRLLTPVLVFVLVCLPARAQTAPGEPLVSKGRQGIWFDLQTARNILRDVTKLKGFKAQLAVAEQLLKLREEREKLLRGAMADGEKLTELWRKTAQHQTAQLLKVIKVPFYKRPAFWFAVGFVTAAAMAVGLTAAVSRSTP